MFKERYKEIYRDDNWKSIINNNTPMIGMILVLILNTTF